MQTNYLCLMEGSWRQLEGYSSGYGYRFEAIGPLKVLVNALVERGRNILDVEFYSCNCSTALSRLQ